MDDLRMGIFREDKPPPLFVPDLSRPAQAEAAADGTVACVTCGVRLPVARMDVVGQGYRCAGCTQQAEIAALATGAVDAAANLSDADRVALRASGTRTLAGGVGSLVLGACVIAFWPRAGLSLVIAGLCTAGLGWQRRKAAG